MSRDPKTWPMGCLIMVEHPKIKPATFNVITICAVLQWTSNVQFHTAYAQNCVYTNIYQGLIPRPPVGRAHMQSLTTQTSPIWLHRKPPSLGHPTFANRYHSRLQALQHNEMHCIMSVCEGCWVRLGWFYVISSCHHFSFDLCCAEVPVKCSVDS